MSLLLGLVACAGGEAIAPIEPGDISIDELIASIDELPVSEARMTEGQPTMPAREGDYQCTTTNLQETRQYDKLVALSANSESLWPGALIAGDSVYTGLFRQLVFERQPLAVSVSLENLAGAKSTIMQRPSLSNFRDSIGQILQANVTGATPANIYSEIEEVHSEQQLTLALGASVSYVGVKVNASFNWDEKEVMSRYLVKYTQAYYTVDVDQPSAASDFFPPTVTTDDVRAKVEPGSPPVYVSSITYGRMVMFTFESHYSSEELGAALDFAYKGGVEVSGNVSVKYRDMISSSKVTAYILGGSGDVAAQSIDSFEALMNFIKTGGNYSKDSPGAPIAYKLAYLGNNEPARLSFTTDYTIKECIRVGQKVKVQLKNVKIERTGGDPGGNLEVFGSITVSSHAKDGADGQPFVLFTRDEAHAVQLDEGETWPQMGVLAETILDVVPQAGSGIKLRANLRESDDLSADDSLGDLTVDATFDSGWRRDVVLNLTGSDARVVVTLSLTPI
jgi:thiol-activated cytolysin